MSPGDFCEAFEELGQDVPFTVYPIVHLKPRARSPSVFARGPKRRHEP